MNDTIAEKIAFEIELIKKQVESFNHSSKSIFLTSSFQSHSIPLLHIISQLTTKTLIYFLNTGFHFPDTLRFKNDIGKLLDLEIISLESPIAKSDQRNSKGLFHFVSDIDYCCYLNKVLPLEPIIKKNDIWISGLRKDQTEFRKQLTKIDNSNSDIVKYYPMLDWTSEMIDEYRALHKLPAHPLHHMTGGSIGCEPCTAFFRKGKSRNSRWEGTGKSECGLHQTNNKK